MQNDVNNLHPSCPAPASPMQVEDNLELEEITLARGAHDHVLERGEDHQDRRARDRRGHNRGDRRERGHDRGDRGDGRCHRDRRHRHRNLGLKQPEDNLTNGYDKTKILI